MSNSQNKTTIDLYVVDAPKEVVPMIFLHYIPELGWKLSNKLAAGMKRDLRLPFVRK